MQLPQSPQVQDAWESLSNAFRLYAEARIAAQRLLQVDTEEAVTNIDRAFEQKLEKFHSLYDLTKTLPGFDYFGRADTSLILTLRNAIHHRDHHLFVSWNSGLLLEGGLARKAGAAYLVGSAIPFEEEAVARFLYPLQDFYRRLETGAQVKNPEKLRGLWNTDLGFSDLAQLGESRGYPSEQVYVDVIPPLISAMQAVSDWLLASGFEAKGFDGRTYLEHFGTLVHLKGGLFTKEVRIPIWAAPGS